MAREEFVGEHFEPEVVARTAAFNADADRIDMLNRLKTATPAQIDAYIDAQVTTVAGARKLFKMVLKAIALDSRS